MDIPIENKRNVMKWEACFNGELRFSSAKNIYSMKYLKLAFETKVKVSVFGS